MRRIFLILMMMTSLVLCATAAFANDAVVDDSSLDKGIVKISYTSSDDATIKVMITKDSGKYVYGLRRDGVKEAFPLQMGNGDYKVSVLKHIGDNKYTYVTTKYLTLNLSDPNLVYLNSIQNINWTTDSKAVKKVPTINAKAKDDSTKLKNVHGFVIKYFVYDWDKIPTLKSDYVPQIDPIYDAKKGICYDYSSVLASMKRYEGMPVKLVKGYTSNVDGYHAWNEVYINGKWEIIDSTYDSAMYHDGGKFKMFKPASEYEKVNEY